MAFLNSSVLDSGLSWLVTNGTKLDICTSEPATYANIATYTKGNKTGLVIGSPAARSPSGRKVAVPAISDGSVTGDGTVGFWAISNGTNTLVAAGSLSASQAVTNGNTFTLITFDIGIPGPA